MGAMWGQGNFHILLPGSYGSLRRVTAVTAPPIKELGSDPARPDPIHPFSVSDPSRSFLGPLQVTLSHLCTGPC